MDESIPRFTRPFYSMLFEFDDRRVLDSQTKENGIDLYVYSRSLGFNATGMTHRHDTGRTTPIIRFSGSSKETINLELILERGVFNVLDWLGRVGLTGISFTHAEIAYEDANGQGPVRQNVTIEAHVVEQRIRKLQSAEPADFI